MVNVQGRIPAPLNYAPPGYKPYPKSICTSVNHQVCHGVPGDRKLKNGDIVNIDITVDQGRLSRRHQPHVLRRRAVDPGQAPVRSHLRMHVAGHRPGQARRASGRHRRKPSSSYAEEHGYTVVREFCGHGIGTPVSTKSRRCCTTASAGTGIELQAGMIFTIEPMINAGRAGIRELADGWTIVTKDHSLSAQWEHTVLVTRDGFEVLTLSAGRARRRRRAKAAAMTVALAPAATALVDSVAVPTCEARAQSCRRGELELAYRRAAAPRDCSRARRSRLDDVVLRAAVGGASTPPRRAARWSPSAATGAASCSRTPTSICCILLPRPLPSLGRQRSHRALHRPALGHAAWRSATACAPSTSAWPRRPAIATVRTSAARGAPARRQRALFCTASGRASTPCLDAQAFFDAKMLEQEQRHLQYQDTPYSLEPNCKESPGGLRDLQTMLWVAQAAGFGNTWSELAAQRAASPPPRLRQLARHERFLQRPAHPPAPTSPGAARTAWCSTMQTALAEQLGFADDAARRASEQLMQRYYRTAKAVTQLNALLLQNIEARLFPRRGQAPQPLDDRLPGARRAARIARRGRCSASDPSAILESFPAAAAAPRAQRHVGAHAARAVARAPPIDAAFRRDPANRARFLEPSCSSRAA